MAGKKWRASEMHALRNWHGSLGRTNMGTGKRGYSTLTIFDEIAVYEKCCIFAAISFKNYLFPKTFCTSMFNLMFEYT